MHSQKKVPFNHNAMATGVESVCPPRSQASFPAEPSVSPTDLAKATGQFEAGVRLH